MSSAAGASTDTPTPAPPKPRMIITYDQYITLQSLIVMHLSKVEQETGNGLDRDELIDWYLESKEAEIDDVAELDRERELITKMLRKLVKVGSFSEPPWPGSNFDNRTTTSSKYAVTCKSHSRPSTSLVQIRLLPSTARMSVPIIWSTLPSIQTASRHLGYSAEFALFIRFSSTDGYCLYYGSVICTGKVCLPKSRRNCFWKPTKEISILTSRRQLLKTVPLSPPRQLAPPLRPFLWPFLICIASFPHPH